MSSPLRLGQRRSLAQLRYLNFHSLYYAEWRFRRNDSRQTKARCFIEFVKFPFGALAAAGHHQHVQVHELTEVKVASCWHDGFDQNQFSVIRERAMTVFQNRDRLLVVPVMN